MHEITGLSHTKEMQIPLTSLFVIFNLFILALQLNPLSAFDSSLCRSSCVGITVNYPFGLDDGCGAPQYRNMLNCSTSLFFQTPSGNYKVQSIDYNKNVVTVYDPAMSTCSILQPHHDFVMTDIQYAIIPPSPDTIFVLLNCSIDSPVLNHYSSLCFNFSGHSCDELYDSCNAFRLFHLVSSSNNSISSSNISTSTSSNNVAPPCCFTGYNTVKYMSMNILDCSHYTTVYDTDNLRGVTPLDWSYGIKLSYSIPDTGCDRCVNSGGTCGFDTETEGMLCLCSSSVNSTRQCAAGSVEGGGDLSHTGSMLFQAFALVLGFVCLL